MALVNTPPITPPRVWLEDPALTGPVKELYFFLWQIYQRTGGGTDTIEVDNNQITINTTNIDNNENAWPNKLYSGDDFQLAFVRSVQGSDYTTYTNEIIKLSRNITVTLNPNPSDEEQVYIKSTGKGFKVTSTKRIDGKTNITYRKPYVGRWFSYSLELDTWSIL